MRRKVVFWGALGLGAMLLTSVVMSINSRARENRRISLGAGGARSAPPGPGTFSYRVRYTDTDADTPAAPPASVAAGASQPLSASAPRAPKAALGDAGGGNEAGGSGGDQPAFLGTPAAAATLPTPADAGRKVVMTATLTLEVKEFQQVHGGIIDTARQMGGYVATSQLTLPGEGQQGATVTVRVPQYRYADALKAIKQYGKVLAEEQSAEDVTEKYIDLDARLRNLKAQEERVLTILKQARTIRDTLTVDERLTELRGNVESLEGQLRYLRYQVTMATITVTLTEKATAVPPPPPSTWSVLNDFRGAWGVVVGVLQNMATLIAYILTLALLWAPLALVAWVGYRRFGRPLKGLDCEAGIPAK